MELAGQSELLSRWLLGRHYHSKFDVGGLLVRICFGVVRSPLLYAADGNAEIPHNTAPAVCFTEVSDGQNSRGLYAILGVCSLEFIV